MQSSEIGIWESEEWANLMMTKEAGSLQGGHRGLA